MKLQIRLSDDCSVLLDELLLSKDYLHYTKADLISFLITKEHEVSCPVETIEDFFKRQQ